MFRAPEDHQRARTDPRFYISLRNTLVYVVGTAALGTLIGLAPALLIPRLPRARGLPLRVLATSGDLHRHSIISSCQVFATGQIMTRDGPSNVDEAAEAANRLMHGRSS